MLQGPLYSHFSIAPHAWLGLAGPGMLCENNEQKQMVLKLGPN
jgi:hypothetical protein